jgi:hypothetical protein
MPEPLDVMRTVVFADDGASPFSGANEATVIAGALPPGFVVVHPRFAERLTSEHSQWVEVEVPERHELTRDVPNVGEEALADLDERGLVKVGAQVKPGALLVGLVTPREGTPLSPEEKLLRAIFGEAAGDVVDRSSRAPAWCSGTVTVAELEGRRARVQVSWARPLEPGDELELDGQAAVVAAIAPIDADLACVGVAAKVRVTKRFVARELLEARSIGPYDVTTQLPLIGRDRNGGQRLEPALAEVLAAHAPWMAWECQTLKADDVMGRTRAYEALVKQENPAKDVVDVAPAPESSPAPVAPPSGMRDIFSFFEKPKPGGDTPAGITLLQALLEAMGLAVRLADDAPGVSVLSDDEVTKRSHGLVKPGDLASQKLFGPERDYECACGKYKRMKHRGVVCEKCGVEVIQSKVRRERFGHLALPGPCVHPLRRDVTLTVLPVLPPGLRLAPSPLDDLYGRLLEAGSVEVAQALLDELVSTLTASVEQAWAAARAKPVDFSGRAALVVDPSLAAGQCRVPMDVLLRVFAPHAYGALEAAGYTTTIKSSKSMVEQRKPEALRAVTAVSAGVPVLLVNGARAVSRTVTAWDAPAIAVDVETFGRLGGGLVQLFAPISTQAALELSAFPDAPSAPPSAPRGWLSEAWRAGELMPFVLRAASSGERQEEADLVLRAVVGRPPSSAPGADVMERWENERRERQAAAMREPAAEAAAQGASSLPPHWERSLDELEFSVRTANALATMGLQTVGDLCQRTEAELLKANGFARQSLKEVKELLNDLGLTLGMRP